MTDQIQKIIELINARNSTDNALGKLLMQQLTLSEAWIVCNNTIEARKINTVRFLFDMFDPRTYPFNRSKHVLQWSKIGEWVQENPDQKVCLRKDRKWDLSTEVKYKVCKMVTNTREPYLGEQMILAQYGKFVKETRDYYVFNGGKEGVFKVGRVTLISIDPVAR